MCVAIVEGAVRLVNGNNASEGRVEIYLQGQWGTVCDDLWDIREATVVCKQLGFLDAISAVGSAEFGEGSGPIQLDDLPDCVGNETTLIHCSARPIKEHNCAHSEDAGVRCNPQTLCKYTDCKYNVTAQCMQCTYNECEFSVKIILNKNTWSVKKCEDNQKQCC